MIENFSNEKEKIKNDLNNRKKYEILDSLNTELLANIDKLIASYKGGEDLFKRRIIEIIRPNLIKKVENISKDLFSDLVENISINKKLNKNKIIFGRGEENICY